MNLAAVRSTLFGGRMLDRSACALAVLCACGAPLRAQAPLFLELECSPREPFVEQRLLVRLRFGLALPREREAWTQPFARELEVPVALSAPWIGKPSGLVALDPAPETNAAPLVQCALDGELCGVRPRGRERREELEYDVWELERWFVAPQAGPLLLPPLQAFAVLAVHGEEDFLGRPHVLERREQRASTLPLALTVREAPAHGRPAAFRGAVGRIELSAEVDRTHLAYDESLRLTLRIRGDAPLARLALPRPDANADFHVLGSLDTTSEKERVAIFDLAPRRHGALELGPFELAYLEPGAVPAYRVSSSAGFRVEVENDPRAPRDPHETGSPAANAADEPARSAWPWIALSCAALALARAVVLFRRRAHAQRDARAVPLGLSAAYTRRVHELAEHPGTAFAAELARLLACEASGVIARDLAQRLESRGATRETAQLASRALEAAIGSRYGSRGGPELADAPALLDRLERECAPAAAPER